MSQWYRKKRGMDGPHRLQNCRTQERRTGGRVAVRWQDGRCAYVDVIISMDKKYCGARSLFRARRPARILHRTRIHHIDLAGPRCQAVCVCLSGGVVGPAPIICPIDTFPRDSREQGNTTLPTGSTTQPTTDRSCQDEAILLLLLPALLLFPFPFLNACLLAIDWCGVFFVALSRRMDGSSSPRIPNGTLYVNITDRSEQEETPDRTTSKVMVCDGRVVTGAVQY